MNHRSKQIYSGFVGKFRHADWLERNSYGPNVFLFRNLETGQVLYTQVPYTQAYNIKKQFQRPNWQNRLPDPRRDIWRPMAVAQLPSYELAVELYDSLVQLRQLRDVTQRDLANTWRKRNLDGNIWNSGQFRPTYTQEAVADLAEVLNAFNTESTVYWESQWRRGDDKYWGSLIKHDDMPKFNPRDSYVVLRALGTKHYEEFKALKASEAAQQAAVTETASA